MRFSEDAGKFKVAKNFRPEEWTDAREALISKHRWDEALESAAPSKPPVVDAEVEIRKVIDRLERISEEPGREIVHSFIVSKIRALLFEYGTSAQYDLEGKRGRTLFDASTAGKQLEPANMPKALDE